ncbi:MAG: hypothetical protein DCF25_01000 [Leptolyngbya foveolarum]|uniref:histidine kinase n=1 Tax=Leptolyngbya foveolarum TaxID=47253 RepID=A0A2W4WGJ7_9CYAN|nr:MAG: hypothetical protein DCF25_01000 [Leptolyngbya foveolarum]
MLPEQQQRIMGYFIEEAKDHLNTIEQGLLNLQATIQDGEKANELFRAAHSVKGGAAMLGLESIQQIAHRMEDYFKILKESPVQVDRALETMFLRVSDGLKNLLEQLEGPFGLTPDKAQEIMADVEPVFGQLETHLASLVSKSGATSTTVRQVAEAQFSSGASATPEALQTSFKHGVTVLLRQLLTAFKLDDNLESRKTLRDACTELISIGQQFDLTEWCDLAETARIAVGELSNDYRQLAPVLIKEIKKAQDMVLTGRASEVAISDAMQALLPEDPLTETASNELSDLFGEADEAEDLFNSPLTTEDADEFKGLFDSHSADSLFVTDEESDELANELFAEIPDEPIQKLANEEATDSELNPVNRLSMELEFDEIPSELSALNRNAGSAEKADESLDALLATVNVTGPDVGSEELNSLADLFDGDLDELDNTLGNHTFISEEMRLNPEGIGSVAEEDLADFFAEDKLPEEDSETDENELEEEDLFGGTLTDGEFAELDNSFIDDADLDALNISPGAYEESISAEAENVVEEDEADEFGDLWSDKDLFGESISETGSVAETVLADEFAESSEDLEESVLLGEMAALREDVWLEDEQDVEERSLHSFSTAVETTSSELETAELADFSSSSLLDDLNLDLLDIEDADVGSLLKTESPTENTVQQTRKLSLTEHLIEAKSVPPRELEIEFPTLIGVKLQEAEEDIDSFFMGEDDADTTAKDLEADNPWSELSLDLFTMTEESELEDDLDFDSDVSESRESIKEDTLEIADQAKAVDDSDLAAIFIDSPETNFDAISEIEAAESELEALLGVPDETFTSSLSDDLESDDMTDDLWGDLEAASDLLEAQTEDADLDFSLSFEATPNSRDVIASESDFEDLVFEDSDFEDLDFEDSSLENSDFNKASEKILSEERLPASATDEKGIGIGRDTGSIEEENTNGILETVLSNEGDSVETGSILEDDFLTTELSADSTDNLELAADSNTPLSEADLLDFDTAFGLGLTETDDFSAGEAAADSQDVDLSDEEDLPTFSGDLDEFADAADGETTISDITDLRLEDAELDSLLGLDFAVDKSERSPKNLLENDSQVNGSIDRSVIEAFSDIDDLFDEESLSADADDLSVAPEEAPRGEVDEDDFFGWVPEETDEEANEGQDTEDFTDFDDLDALLSEEADEPTVTGNLPMLTPTLTGFGEEATSGLSVADMDDFDDLERLLGDGEADGEPTTRRTAARSQRRIVNMREQNMRVSVKHLDNLSNLVGELVVSRNTLERDQERLRQFLDNLLFQVQQLNDVGQRLRDLYERSLLESSLMSNKRLTPANSTAKATANNHATGAIFDALEMDRFTGFHSLSQEMIELIVRVRESSSDIGYTVESSDQVTRQFRQITTQLQEGLNTARMVAFSQAADRLPRAVRDISLKCGKEARLVVEGQDTLIDKMLVEHLYDPLTHLVNNAITHGIERPETRTSAGKSAEGKITVRAFYQGNQTVIYVADDGGGIDTKFVQRKAIEKGLISQATAEGLSDIETYDLLFQPGFSTRDQADDFAGRGVGMDVVRTSLAEIRGSITIDSELGRGTSFTIRLPLTLSISKALSCVSNQARIAFPMDGVEDMLDVPRDRVIKNDQDQDCVRWRETLLPFQPVTNLLKFNRTLGRGRVYGGSQDDDVISVIVLRNANTYVAVQVDQVIGEEEIVIKQLEGPVPKPLGIAGATVMGDGRVMPIADVLELIDIAMGRVRRESSSMMWAQAGMAAVEEAPAKVEPTVLIVDDSITVRELLSMSFNKVGYRVEQARDGQEAWDKLRSGLPCDLVFCDIEMPRMDGLELLSRMQKDSQLKRVPIAMLTSRGADRHRQMAVDLGASGYFTKPYLEEALLDAAQRMLNGESLEKGRGG